MNRSTTTFRAPRRANRAGTALAVVGGAATLLGLLLAPRETWANVLAASYGLLGMGLGGAVFMALLYVTAAGWGVALRRVPEALVALLPVGAAGLAVVFVAQPALYSWTVGHAGVGAEAGSPFKQAWLDWPFFLGRAVAYIAAWALFTRALVRTSRRQDADGEVGHTSRNVRLSAAFLVVFAVTFWLASSDWIMSLEPEWASTMFGVYNFAGLFLGGLAAVVALVVWLQAAGPLRHVVASSHLHDLGKLLFAFSTFWAYIWFCQYMLIWYVNNPEETSYFVRRLEGAWGPLLVINVVLNWVVPFVVLLPRAAKRNPRVLAQVAVVLLVGRWLDLCLMILPACGDAATALAAAAGPALGAVGLAVLVVLRALQKAALVPWNDPYLVESLPHQQPDGHSSVGRPVAVLERIQS
jgi:hypothetical protein